MRLTIWKLPLLCLALLMVAIGPSPAQATPHWVKVVLADIGGAGAGFLTGGVPGAFAGGGGASADACGVVRPKESSVSSNPKNSLDWVGAMHNQILVDYFKVNKTYEIDTFYQFAQKNKKSYRIDSLPPIEQVKKAVESAGDENTSVEELWTRIDKRFKAAGIKQDIVGRLKPLFPPPKVPGPTFPVWEASILQIENEAIQSKDLTKDQVQHLEVFFSTLRNSAKLWYNTERVKP